MATLTTTPQRVDGLRERNKSDKRRRIREAARDVFVERGYEAATTREIATRADVSIGTVFVYARDKRDLLLLIVNDELDEVGAKGRGVLDGDGALLDKLMAFFKLRYAYWAREPRLARPALRETFDFLEPDERHGDETRRFYSRRPQVIAQVERLVADAVASAEVRADIEPAELASMLFNLYLIEARRWLAATTPRAAEGLARLRSVLDMVLRGALAR